MDPETIIKSYFSQLYNGCNSLECQEEYCCSCRFFIQPEIRNNPNLAAYYAILYSIRHPSNPHICPYISPDLLYPNILPFRINFDKFIKNLSKGILNEFQKEEINYILYNCLSHEKIFIYLLLNNFLKFFLINLSLSNELLEDLIISSRNYYYFFLFSIKYFKNLFLQIINSKETNSYLHIRSLFLIIFFLIIFKLNDYLDYVFKFIYHISILNKKELNLFWSQFSELPFLIKEFIQFILESLNIFFLRSTPFEVFKNKMLESSSFFLNLYSISNLSTSKFYINLFTKKININDEILNHKNNNPSFLKCSLFLPLNEKSMILKELSRSNPLINQILIIEINRNYLIKDSIRILSKLNPEDYFKQIKIIFIGEVAVDQGGVTREYFYQLISLSFSPDYGMFTLLNNKYYWFTTKSFENFELFNVLGTIVALSILNNVILPIRFPLILYKKLLNKKILLNDLIDLDLSFVQSANSLIEMKNNNQDIKELYLNFSITIEEFGIKKDYPLIDNGLEIDVTNDNLEIYIESYIEWISSTSINRQYLAFLNGFNKVPISKHLILFQPDELDILVSGEEIYDWKALKENVIYSGYKKNSIIIKHFWEFFDNLSHEKKLKFLRFTTGSDRTPVGGLGKLKIKIEKLTDTKKLPISHTCFNIFSLPNYINKSDLIEIVSQAIEFSEGFGFV